jgi:hypothetical protein
MRKLVVVASLILSAFLNGCATVPMASVESDKERKEFSHPSQGNAGLYIYRNSAFGGALRKSVYVDGQLVGETAPMTYIYKEVEPGKRILSTESEFSNNDLTLDAKTGQNYFVRQYIKLGLFVGGANLRIVSEEEGKKGVLQCNLANTLDNNSLTYSPKTDESVIEQTLETEQPAAFNLSGTYISEITSNSKWQFTKKYQKLKIKFTQNGNKISGVDDRFNTKIEATIVGDVLNFYVLGGQATGFYDVEGEWKISSSGTRLEGTWEAPNSADGAVGNWILKKIE